MANIPTIPGTESVQSPQIGVQIDPRAGLQVGASLSQAVGAAADAISAYEEKKQKLIDINVQNTAALTLTKAANDYRNRIAKGEIPDDQVVPGWQETFNNVHAQLGDELSKASPEARQAINYQVQMKGLDTTGEMQAVSAKMLINKTIGTSDARIKNAVLTGDMSLVPGIKANLDQLVSQKVLTQEEADLKLTEAKQGIIENNAAHTISANPQLVIDTVNAGGYKEILNQNKRDGLVHMAMDQQRNNLSSLVSQNIDPISGQVPENLVNEWMDSGLINRKAGTGIINGQRRQDYSVNVQGSREIRSLIRNPATWQNGNASVIADDFANRIVTEITNVPLRDSLLAYLNKQADAVQKTGKTSEPEFIRTGLTELNNDPLNTTASIYKAVTAKDNKNVYQITDRQLTRLYSGYGSNRQEIIKSLQSINAKQEDDFAQKMQDFVDANKRPPTATEKLKIKNDVLSSNITANVLSAFHGKTVSAPIPYRNDVVLVTRPDGVIGTIKKTDITQALAAGYKLNQ